jgi:hypothetical protein
MENRKSEKYQSIDRRKFLLSASIVGASVASPTVASGVTTIIPSDPEATIRRQDFEAVTARNRLRQEAQLPLLNVEAEVRVLLGIHREQHFRRFLESNWDQARMELGIDKAEFRSGGVGHRMDLSGKVRALVWQWWCLC